jgi:hypothetical protein
MNHTLHNAGNPLHIEIESSTINPTSIKREVSTLPSPSETPLNNGIWSAYSYPACDLDFSQFLSPEVNEGHYALFNSRKQSVLLDLADDVMFTPLDLDHYIHSTPLTSPAIVAGDSVLSPEDAWSNKYYQPPLDTFLEVKREVVSDSNEEVVREEENLPLKRKEKGGIHPCTICDRKFSRRFNMRTHLKTHDKSRYVLRLF